MYSCAACYETFASPDDLYMQFDCGHAFCSTCVVPFLRSSLDSGPFPPRCCGHHTAFPDVERLRSIVPSDLRAKLDKGLEELRAEDRTYCSVPTCSSFIRSSQISGNDATCPACARVTCVACKAATHEGECPDSEADPALQQLLQTAAMKGWRRCGRCLTMIERTEGCNHMS
jgi:hypothetical protein